MPTRPGAEPLRSGAGSCPGFVAFSAGTRVKLSSTCRKLAAQTRKGAFVFHRVLLGLAAAILLAGAAIADDAETCSDDNADPAVRADTCTRMIRSGKYRGNDLAAVHNNRGIAYRRQNDLTRAQNDYSEAIRLNPQILSTTRPITTARW